MKYFIIAGEASGDLHASNLVTAIREEDKDAEFMFLGGDLMERAAEKPPLRHYAEMNFMGFAAVLKNLRRLLSILGLTRRAILGFSPDVVILVDYAGFNMRIARFAARKGVKVFYYISPKVWAWRKRRIRSLRRYTDRIFVIFPFEVDYFRSKGMEVEYHGNPLVDMVHRFEQLRQPREQFLADHHLDQRPLVALLAGSRKQEIEACLPEMLSAAHAFPGYQFVVAGAPSADHSAYKKILEGSDVQIVYDATYQLLAHASAAVVTSGTATLETALFNVPQVVVYKTGKLTYSIGKIFITFRFFSLVNLILGRELVKELLQVNLAERIEKELGRILNDAGHRLDIEAGYGEIKKLLGDAGTSSRVARKMLEMIQ